MLVSKTSGVDFKTLSKNFEPCPFKHHSSSLSIMESSRSHFLRCRQFFLPSALIPLWGYIIGASHGLLGARLLSKKAFIILNFL